MSKWKTLMNSVVEKTVVNGINHAGEYLDKTGSGASILNVMARGLASESVRLAGREITKDQILRMVGNCTKSGATGAAIDGIIAAHQANKMYKIQKIDRDTFIEHVSKETACGFVSSASGSAATIIASLIVGGSGPASVLVGIGTAIGTRYAYRIIIDDALEKSLEKDATPLREQISFDDLFGSDNSEGAGDGDIDIDELLGDSTD